MPIPESLSSLEITKYKSTRDVPYIRDAHGPEFSGAFGVVYRATRRSDRPFDRPFRPFRSNDKEFAVKSIRISAERSRLVAKEITYLRQCRHPNILELEEAYCVEQGDSLLQDTLYLVTKPWAPISLQRFIEDLADNPGDHSRYCSWYQPGRLEPWPMIIRQCLQGIEYLHNQTPYPIRHKDLKPDNILLLDETLNHWQPQVRPIIADLGISKEFIIGSATSNNGTYEFLAPEQIKKLCPTPKSDVFALGCCFTFIEGLLHSGREGLRDVYDAALGTESCCFANNVSSVNALLDSPPKPSLPVKSAGLSYFRQEFRLQVKRMLEINPDDREDITTLIEKYTQLETQLEEHPKSSRFRICVSIGPATTLGSIDMLQVADDNEFVDQISSLFNKEQNCGRGILAPLFQVKRIRFVNFIVPDNAKQRVLDLKDGLLDFTPSYEPDRLLGDLMLRALLLHLNKVMVPSRYPLKHTVDSIKMLIERYKESEIPMRAWGIEIQDGMEFWRIISTLLLLFKVLALIQIRNEFSPMINSEFILVILYGLAFSSLLLLVYHVKQDFVLNYRLIGDLLPVYLLRRGLLPMQTGSIFLKLFLEGIFFGAMQVLQVILPMVSVSMYLVTRNLH